MELYGLTLNAIKTLLTDIGMKKYADIVGECIDKWESEKNVDMFRLEFNPKGRFADFRIDGQTMGTPEKGLWTAQTFSALLAMAAQLADFQKRGMKADMNFIRSRFGAANEILTAALCKDCGHREATAMDVDKYVSKIVIFRRTIKGLESGELDKEVKELINVTSDDIARERRKTKLRLENTGVVFTDVYGRLVNCPKCKSKNIAEGRLLRSLKENVFVPLSK